MSSPRPAASWLPSSRLNGGQEKEQAARQWPTPVSLQSELPSVEAFAEKLLPASFRPLVLDVAERMQVPLDLPAIVAVLSLAGVVNRRARIQPKACDTSWLVVPNLWGGLIAAPGFLKSPVIQIVIALLLRIQSEWRSEYEKNLEYYTREKEAHEIRLGIWKSKVKETKAGQPEPPRPPEPEAPVLRRLIVNDATFEALHATMNENPAGILLIRDELTGWWSMLDRQGREGERAFCLQAWNGDTSHTVDRIGRGSVHVEACCMSMLGGIQPGRLRSYLVDALKDGPSNDGLIQRFQLLVWPDMPPAWEYVDRAPDIAAENCVRKVFEALAKLDPDPPREYHFTLDAQKLFIEWLTELEAKLRSGELHPALVSHLSKYRSLMPSLALLFELADAVGRVEWSDTVSLDHAQQAVAWCKYLESHARRVYSCIVTPQIRAAIELADKIKHGKVGADGFFSCRYVYLKGWSSLDSPEAVKQAADVLEDAGWIRETGSQSSDPLGRGRPSSRYEINPAVRPKLKEQTKP
jgi:putative DNA primase/helicase